MTMQAEFIKHLQAKAATDDRVRAAWLAGSFGRDIADRYSDVDTHVLLVDETVDEFRQGVRGWLEEIRPLVLFNLMFDGQMVNGMTVDGLRLDLWIHSDETATVAEGAVQVLHAADGALDWQPAPGAMLTQAEAERQLARLIPEFWRCVSMLPVGIGRQELIASAAGAFLEVQLLTDVLATERGLRLDRGVKARNDYLPKHLRQALEEAIVLPALTSDALIRFHLRLAALMQQHGPAICAQWHVDYPAALEEAVLRYVATELEHLNHSAALDELHRYPVT